MKALLMAVLFSLVAMMNCDARAVRVLGMKALMEESALVFAGRVRSVTPSGMGVELSYPTWDGAVFEWLKVEVEVVEPMKGVKRGAVVTTMMLTIRDSVMFNPPGVVEPKVGRAYLCCLVPIADGKGYASITAPFDDDQGVFLLDRKEWTREGTTYYKGNRVVSFREQDEKSAALWNLVSAKGQILSSGAEAIRVKYREEISTPAKKESVVHLNWKKVTGRGGWQWNEPDEGKKEEVKPRGAVRSGPAGRW